MVTTHRDGSVTAEVSTGDDIVIGTVAKDDDGDWTADCFFCADGFLYHTKAEAVEALEEHFTLKHATPDL